MRRACWEKQKRPTAMVNWRPVFVMRSPTTMSPRPGASLATRRRFTRWPSPGHFFRPKQQRAGASRRLADLVRKSGHRISTGFAGTPLILDALTDGGYSDVAYRLLFQHEVPSWMYAVSMGATTVWERWDSMLPDGSINPGEMTSFNHYALGAVADYLHRVVAGLAPLAPGYRKIIVRPVPGRALTHARARQLTPYGSAEVAWRRQDGRFSLEVCVPSGNYGAGVYPRPGNTGDRWRRTSHMGRRGPGDTGGTPAGVADRARPPGKRRRVARVFQSPGFVGRARAARRRTS